MRENASRVCEGPWGGPRAALRLTPCSRGPFELAAGSDYRSAGTSAQSSVRTGLSPSTPGTDRRIE